MGEGELKRPECLPLLLLLPLQSRLLWFACIFVATAGTWYSVMWNCSDQA